MGIKKNKKRFDPRYFMDEKLKNEELIVENSVQNEKLKKNFHDFSLDSWESTSLLEDAKKEEGDFDDGDGVPEKCDYVDCEDKNESVDEGHGYRQQPVLRKDQWTPEDEERQKEWERKKKEAEEKERPSRGTAEIDFTLEEGMPGFEHIGPQEMSDMLGALSKMVSIWVPVFGIAGFGLAAKAAFEYLANKPAGTSHEDAIEAVSTTEDPEKIEMSKD